MAELGVAIFLLSLAIILVAVIIFLVSATTNNKRTAKMGLYVMLTGAVGLLISLSLCSMGKFNI